MGGMVNRTERARCRRQISHVVGALIAQAFVFRGEHILAVQVSYSHTPTTHMAPQRINFCLGLAECWRRFGTALNEGQTTLPADHKKEISIFSTLHGNRPQLLSRLDIYRTACPKLGQMWDNTFWLRSVIRCPIWKTLDSGLKTLELRRSPKPWLKRRLIWFLDTNCGDRNLNTQMAQGCQWAWTNQNERHQNSTGWLGVKTTEHCLVTRENKNNNVDFGPGIMNWQTHTCQCLRNSPDLTVRISTRLPCQWTNWKTLFLNPQKVNRDWPTERDSQEFGKQKDHSWTQTKNHWQLMIPHDLSLK